jgi:ATP-dependent Lon protease
MSNETGTGGTKVDARKGFSIDEIETTADITIPNDPLDRVIGQDEAIEVARVSAMQRRHLLLVGPPGTGKSMIAQALSLHLHRPKEEIRVVHNPANPERPKIEVKKADEVHRERESLEFAEGEIIDPNEAPIKVAEQFGYRCTNCGTYSSPRLRNCEKCGSAKLKFAHPSTGNPFGDLLNVVETISQISTSQNDVITTTRMKFGKEEVVAYERAGEMIRVLDQKSLEKRREYEKISPRKVIVPLDRKPFVLATGASETELLGDVRHDPYGGHPQLGTPPYERVLPGAIHEAHEGVLFIDELPHLTHLQRFILTAMQEKKFPIVGRNPQSAGASVKVENVPCDFIFVGACNIQDLPSILSPLRSRVVGNGYEVLVETVMADSDTNRAKLSQFIAQEIVMDGNIPHAARDAVHAIVEEAKRRARVIDGREKALTLRLRELGGLIRAAGDYAIITHSELIRKKHIQAAIERAKPVEEQIRSRYGSYYGGLSADITSSQKENSNQYYWNQYKLDDKSGYK